MEPTKSTREVMQKASELKGPAVEWFRKNLTDEFGNLVDQLRVVGYLGQMLMELAEEELKLIKVQSETDAPKIRVYQS